MKNKIKKECRQIEKLLIDKNKKYGNSALEPIRIFSKKDNVEQLKVRIDDKISRIKMNGTGLSAQEDTITDLIGYLILLKIAFKRGQNERNKIK